MRNGLNLGLLIVTALFLAGCTSPDENPDWNPRAEYPSWAYDAPFYYQPAEEMKPQETIGKDIPVYYIRKQVVFLRHPNLPADWRTTPPASYGDKELPAGKDRADFIKNLWKAALPGHDEVWFSQDAGQHWIRAGYFGLEQSHYLFDSGGDGNFWIRFVGPKLKPAKVPPGQPHEIVVVDTHAPEINVTVTPGPWEDEDKKIPHYYTVGETVTVSWTVSDMSLEKDTVKLSTAYAYFPHNVVWSEYDKPLPPNSAMQVKIPAEACKQPGMRFRIVARDKSGNIGLGMSEIMQIDRRSAPAPEIIETESTSVEKVETVKPTPAPAEDGEFEPADDTEDQPQPEEPAETSKATENFFQLDESTLAVAEKKTPAVTKAEPVEEQNVVPLIALVDAKPEKKPQEDSIKWSASKSAEPLETAIAIPVSPAPKQAVAAPSKAEISLLESAIDQAPQTSRRTTAAVDRSNLVPPACLFTPVKKPAKKAPKAYRPALATAEKAPQKAAPAPAMVFNNAEEILAAPEAETKPEARQAVVKFTPVEPKAETVRPAAKPVVAKAYFETAPELPAKPAPAPMPIESASAEAETVALEPAPVPVKTIAVIETKEPEKLTADSDEPLFVNSETQIALAQMPAESETTELTKILAPTPFSKNVASASPSPKLKTSQARQLTKISPQPVQEIKSKSTPAGNVNIPEAIKLGWPGRGMTLRSGMSRLLSWVPDTASEYQTLELQFSSSDGKKWTTVTQRVKPGRALTWTVPVVNSANCRLRIVGRTQNGGKDVLVTSDVFVVDTGVWETIDLSGYSTENGKKRS